MHDPKHTNMAIINEYFNTLWDELDVHVEG